jgi:hypothetical protein
VNKLLLTAATVLVPSIAFSDELTFKSLCHNIGAASPQEQLGDRENHAISVGNFVCQVQTGPLAGGLVTGDATYEWDKGVGVLKVGGAVYRKGPSILVESLDSKIELVMDSGKVTGWAATGKTTWVAGNIPEMIGKTATWTAKPVSPNDFEVVDVIK